MQTIPDQISSMTRPTVEAQLELFGSFALASVENAGKLAQFQIDASRSAMDQACAAWRQLLAAGPQNLFAALAQAQSNMGAMTRSPFFTPAQAAGVAEQSEATDSGPQEPFAASEDDESPDDAPSTVAEPHASQPTAQRTDIAAAASQFVADGQSSVPLAAAPVPEDGPVTLPKMQPLEAAPPPPALSHGINQRRGLPRK